MIRELLEQLDGDEPQTPHYKIFVDLDGVLADFSKGVNKILDGQHSEERYETDPQYRKQMWQALGRYQKQGGEFWYDLDPMSDAHMLWQYVAPYQPEILSATGNPQYNGESQKRQWVAKHLGKNVVVNLTRSATEKAKYAAENHILIDDKDKAILPWEAAGGIGILHTDAASTIKKLKQLGL